MVQTCLLLQSSNTSCKVSLLFIFQKSSTPPGMIVETPLKYWLYLQYIYSYQPIDMNFFDFRLLAFPTGVGVKDKVYVIVMTCRGRAAPKFAKKNNEFCKKHPKKYSNASMKTLSYGKTAFYVLDILSICRGSSRLKNILRPW